MEKKILGDARLKRTGRSRKGLTSYEARHCSNGLAAWRPNPTRAGWRAAIPNLAPRISAQFGPSRFGPGKLSGSDFVHTLQWQRACRCWRSVSDFRPAAA
jgi:hypothetical protein